MSVLTRSGSDWMVDRNLQLVCDFDQAIMDDPSILDRIPDGATVILMPQNDTELARANLELAMRDLQAGKDVLLIPV